jgi:secondary thiamine-phosphate synthase enzyme
MRQAIRLLGFETQGRGLLDITHEINAWIRDIDIRMGLITLMCQHTSASLIITENASPAARRDLLRWLDAAVPEGPGYEHDDEGADDMPAHIKAVLTQTSLSIPVADGRMMLGTWQGLFLAEHRAQGMGRTIAIHMIGD